MLEMMRVRVLFFSVLRDLTGVEELEVEVEEGTRLGGLMEGMFERWPRLGEWDASLLLAVDQAYAGREVVLSSGCEVAVMPPVQGG
jgi:molybdopterin converting factor small subunit